MINKTISAIPTKPFKHFKPTYILGMMTVDDGLNRLKNGDDDRWAD
jgi:hypothetical protein